MKKSRSMLFIPSNNPGMIQNAHVFGADTIIFDLEDAVDIGEKDGARRLLEYALGSLDFEKTQVLVRLNPITTDIGLADLDMLMDAKIHGLVVPMADVKQLRSIDARLASHDRKGRALEIYPLVETASGVMHVNEIIESSSYIKGIIFGAEDYSADMEIVRTSQGDEIQFARAQISNVCKMHKIESIDTPFTDLDDLGGFGQDILRGKSLGMTGKLAINPKQISEINRLYAPQNQEINRALDIIEASKIAKEKGVGVFSFEGKMVDAPIIKRAESVLRAAYSYGMLDRKEGGQV